jgi:hypothetical protein
MRLFTLTAACAACLMTAPFASAQAKRAAPQPQQPPTFIPLHQPFAPQMNPRAGQVPVINPAQLTPGVNGVPGSTVYVPPFYRNGVNANFPGSVYVINRYNPYGYPAGGFTGVAANSGQFYAFMGGPAPTNPFVSNISPVNSTWPNATGLSPTGQPWNFPFGYYNFSNLPQYPMMMNAPVVGQSNGFFPNPQPPAVNEFGVQQVPGINGFGNQK